MKLKKVDISKTEQKYYENWCRRCDKYYCLECVSFCEVDFDIKETTEVCNYHQIDNWKREKVCPWCYNQLVDIKMAKTK